MFGGRQPHQTLLCLGDASPPNSFVLGGPSPPNSVVSGGQQSPKHLRAEGAWGEIEEKAGPLKKKQKKTDTEFEPACFCAAGVVFPAV